jgi:hypothetical protein
MTSDEMTKEIGHVIEKYEKTPGAMSNITPEELSEQIMDKIIGKFLYFISISPQQIMEIIIGKLRYFIFISPQQIMEKIIGKSLYFILLDWSPYSSLTKTLMILE